MAGHRKSSVTVFDQEVGISEKCLSLQQSQLRRGSPLRILRSASPEINAAIASIRVPSVIDRAEGRIRTNNIA
jgi:hypothetical protein